MNGVCYWHFTDINGKLTLVEQSFVEIKDTWIRAKDNPVKLSISNGDETSLDES